VGGRKIKEVEGKGRGGLNGSGAKKGEEKVGTKINAPQAWIIIRLKNNKVREKKAGNSGGKREHQQQRAKGQNERNRG
jgi:hypothetical protein